MINSSVSDERTGFVNVKFKVFHGRKQAVYQGPQKGSIKAYKNFEKGFSLSSGITYYIHCCMVKMEQPWRGDSLVKGLFWPNRTAPEGR